MIQDIFSLITTCIDELVKTQKEFYLLFIISLILSIGLWFFAANYTRLWNKSFKNRPIHYFLFTIASLMTFVFIILFYSLKFTEYAANYTVLKWENTLKNDNEWQGKIFIKAYEAVEKSGKVDMTNYKHPDNGGTSFPSPPEIRPISAAIYSNESTKHFKENHPLLRKILWAKSENAIQKIRESMDDFFISYPDKKYNVEDAIEIAARQISLDLKEQTPKVVYSSRILIVLLFFIFQLSAFGIVGFHAYNDLKLKT